MTQPSKEMMKGIAEVIILQTLSKNDECYGYQLTELIAKSSNKAFEMKEGTLYPLLYRLEAKKLITSQKKQSPNGRTRRYYSLTAKGKRVLAEEANEAKNLMRGLSSVLKATR